MRKKRDETPSKRTLQLESRMYKTHGDSGPNRMFSEEMTKRINHTAAQGPLLLKEASFEILGLCLGTHLCAPSPAEGWRGAPS